MPIPLVRYRRPAPGAAPPGWLKTAALLWLLAPPWLAVAETLLLDQPAMFGRIYVSEDDQGLRVMRFEPYGARQSVVKLGDPDHLELPYSRAVPAGLLLVPAPRSALVVGLGGGTLPTFLRAHYPDLYIDVVEIDPVVVEVARSHFGFVEDARLRAHVADGRQFIATAPRTYDLIVLDAYGPDSVPEHLTTLEFLRQVHRILTPRGAVIGNLWGRGANPHYDSMVRTYHEVFDEVRVLDVPNSGNKIVLAQAERSELGKDALLRRARELNTRLRLRHDLAQIVRSGLRGTQDERRRGRVLTDPAPLAVP